VKADSEAVELSDSNYGGHGSSISPPFAPLTWLYARFASPEQQRRGTSLRWDGAIGAQGVGHVIAMASVSAASCQGLALSGRAGNGPVSDSIKIAGKMVYTGRALVSLKPVTAMA
jgi:hypothetical protein